MVDIVRSNDAPHIGQIPDIAPRTLRADPLTLATVLAHRAFIDIRRGDLTSVEADAHEAIELASDLMGAEFAVVLAVPMAVLAGIERDSSLASLRRLLDHPALREEARSLLAL